MLSFVDFVSLKYYTSYFIMFNKSFSKKKVAETSMTKKLLRSVTEKWI